MKVPLGSRIDWPFARTALISIISRREELKIAAIAENGADAITQYFQHHPDVTVMDLRLPGTSGLEAIRAIRSGDPGARILVLTNYDGSEDIFRALRAGASGYLVKDTSRAELLNAIHSIYRGARYIPEDLRNRLAQRATGSDLTPRELEVLALLAHGGNNREIAKQLNIAEKTTRSSRSRPSFAPVCQSYGEQGASARRGRSIFSLSVFNELEHFNAAAHCKLTCQIFVARNVIAMSLLLDDFKDQKERRERAKLATHALLCQAFPIPTYSEPPASFSAVLPYPLGLGLRLF